MGSFLRSFVKWPKKAQAKSKPAAEGAAEKDKAQKQWTGKLVKIQVFPTASAAAAIDSVATHTHVDELVEFNPEEDYAQVLAEARSHFKLDEQTAADKLSSASKPTFWLQSSQQLAVYRELEAAWERETRSSSKTDVRPTKSLKRWKSLLFWQRSRKDQDVSDFVMSSSTGIFATPQHPSFRLPRNHASGQPPDKGSSGPLYTDGLPSKPSHRSRKSTSGPLSSKFVFYGGGNSVPESPYQPLHHHHRSFNKSSAVAPSPPLYTV